MNRHLSILLGILGILPFRALAEVTPPKDPYAAPVSALSCPADPFITSVRCEGGICLTEAPGGVTTESVSFKGKVKSGGITGLLVQSQHDRTKAITTINASKSLKADGTFEVTVPLPQLGSYTIVIQAMHVGGSPMVMTIHVSRVIAPHDLTAAAVTIPEPKVGEDHKMEDHVMVSVDLEKSCREQVKMGLLRDCDLIGSRTGGTTIEVTNTIGAVRQITRQTNVGTDGQFSLCVPLSDGDNAIEVWVSNPALASRTFLVKKTLSFSKSNTQVRWIDSDPAHLSFAIDHWTPKKSVTAMCDGQIEIEWNHESGMQIVCPVNGEYHLANKPIVGVNELAIHLPDETVHYTFGWGRAVWAKDVMAGATALHIDHAALDRDLPNLLNRFLSSDQFATTLTWMLGGSSAPAAVLSEDVTREMDEIRATIPMCAASASATVTKVVGTPKVGSVRINAVTLSENQLQMDVTLEHVMVQLQVFRDANKDGLPDKGFLPLRIAFKRLQLRPKIVLDPASGKVLLTSDTDDCAFKSATYCKHQPAIVQPKDFVGEIDAAGAFVMCDGEGQLSTDEIRTSCKSINNVDAKTGQLSETILDTLNETLYCGTSTQLTYALKHAKIPLNYALPIPGRTLAWQSELALDPHGISIAPDGIGVSLGSRVESTGFYYTASDTTATATAPIDHTVGFMVREDLLNQALAALVTMGKPGEGLLDMTLDEAKIALMGFDFSTECVLGPGKKELPAPCLLRPTVESLLGSNLTTAHYYDKDQALRIVIRGDRELAPHVRFRNSAIGELILDFDVPNVAFEFLAIPKDPSKPVESIITARITALMSFTVDKIVTNPADPSQLAVTIHMRRAESRVAIMPVPGSNHTILPDYVLVGQLSDKINLGLDQFGKEGESLKTFTIPKKMLLPTSQLSASDETLLSRLGLAEIRLAEGDLQWHVDSFTHSLSMTADPQLVQRLMVGGQMQEYIWGK